MRRFGLIAALLLCLPLALRAQTGAAINIQAIGPTGVPVPYAQLTVCPYTGSGTPCSPQTTIYQDINLTTPLTQPYSTDQYGNATVFVNPGSYIVQIKVSPTIIYSGTVTTSNSGGSGYCPIAGCVFTGPISGTTATFSGLLSGTTATFSGNVTAANFIGSATDANAVHMNNASNQTMVGSLTSPAFEWATGVSVNVLNYGAYGQAIQHTDGVANGTTTFTSASASFASGDVGKVLTINRSAPPGSTSYPNFSAAISSVPNSTAVVLASAPSFSATGLTYFYEPDSSAAFAAASSAANSAAQYAAIYIPAGVYTYYSGLSLTKPGRLPCDEGAVLNYIGSAHAVDLGPSGASVAGPFDAYETSGCSFIGGQNMTEGVTVNSLAVTSDIQANFTNFGPACTNTISTNSLCPFDIYFAGQNWSGHVNPGTTYYNGTQYDLNFVGVNDAVLAGYGHGQSRVSVLQATASNLGAGHPIGILFNGYDDSAAHNKIEGFCPAVWLEQYANYDVIDDLYSENEGCGIIGIGHYTTGGYSPIRPIVSNSYANMHYSDSRYSNSYIYAMASDTFFYHMGLIGNIVSNLDTSSPMVAQNNVAGQIDNRALLNMINNTMQYSIGALHNSGSNITEWFTDAPWSDFNAFNSPLYITNGNSLYLEGGALLGGSTGQYTWIPSFITGYHGGSGDINLQMSDGTGSTGHVAVFDSGGGVTNGGVFVPVVSGPMTGTATTASHTFSTPFSGTPTCVPSPDTSGVGAWSISAVSSTAITVTYANSGSSIWSVLCQGSSGVW